MGRALRETHRHEPCSASCRRRKMCTAAGGTRPRVARFWIRSRSVATKSIAADPGGGTRGERHDIRNANSHHRAADAREARPGGYRPGGPECLGQRAQGRNRRCQRVASYRGRHQDDEGTASKLTGWRRCGVTRFMHLACGDGLSPSKPYIALRSARPKVGARCDGCGVSPPYCP
jgi:hypothetical protein